ncbi:MAG: trigger factor [Chitinophagales bacterium]
MKTKLERIEANEVALEIEVEVGKVEKATQTAYLKLVKKVNVPGFRKGKVPRPIFEAFVGKEALFEEALEEVIPEAYEQAVQDNDIEPVARPKIDIVQSEEGKPLIFKASVVVKPEVKLTGDLKGLVVKVPQLEIKDEDVDSRLEIMRNRYAQLVKADDTAEALLGDVLTIDFTGYLGDEPFPGGTGQDYSLELGSNTFIPGFEEQLVGTKSGQDVTVNVTFPKDYHAEDLKGQEARFEVMVKELKKRELSPLNDDFAKDVSDFDTLEELKDDIRKNLQELAEKRRTQMIRSRVITAACDTVEVEIPVEMIESEVDILLRQFEERLMYQGLNLEQYMQITGVDAAGLRSEFKPQGEKVVKENLVLEALAKEMDLKVTEEDFEAEVDKAAKEYGINPEELKVNMTNARPRIEFGIILDKAANYLIDNAVIEEDSIADADEEEPLD